jgi:hypothetical protein
VVRGVPCRFWTAGGLVGQPAIQDQIGQLWASLCRGIAPAVMFMYVFRVWYCQVVPVIMNARCTIASEPRKASIKAPGSRTSPRRCSIFGQPCAAGSKARRATPTTRATRLSACSSGASPNPRVPVGPVTATLPAVHGTPIPNPGGCPAGLPAKLHRPRARTSAGNQPSGVQACAQMMSGVSFPQLAARDPRRPRGGAAVRPARPAIDGGMAAVIRDETTRRLTVYTDVRRATGPLDIGDHSTIWLFQRPSSTNHPPAPPSPKTPRQTDHHAATPSTRTPPGHRPAGLPPLQRPHAQRRHRGHLERRRTTGVLAARMSSAE